MLRLSLATLHLLALGIGLGAVLARGSALRDASRDPAGAPGALRRAFRADSLWGLAAALWIGTGLWRLLAGTEKPTDYYLKNHVFWGKMGLLLLVLLLEVGPMLSLIRWRVALRRGAPAGAVVSASAGRRIAIVSDIEAALVALMVAAAVAMARGFGAGG